MELGLILYLTNARAIYSCGSSLILDNPNDTDICLVFDDVEKKKYGFEHSPHDTGYCLHFATKEYKPFIGCYAVPLMKKLGGEDIDFKFDIFEEETKKEYIAILRNAVKKLKDDSKQWYHVLTAIYMYENGSYILTEEQKANVQEVHDNGITLELKNYCIEKLQ